MQSLMRRQLLAGLGAGAVGAALLPRRVFAQSRKLRFGVGPFLPTAQDTRTAFTPLFAHLARQLGAPDYDLQVASDWAGLAVAMGSGQLDCAWMGPWGYIIASSSTGCQAVATVKYDDKPTYRAIIIGAAGLKAAKFPDDTRGMSISFADLGSTSGWLVPSYYARKVWNIDPKTFWKYREGASHPANEIAVQERQVDLATDYDRNRNAMIAAGRIDPARTRIVWTSDPLPNDAIAVPRAASADFAGQVRTILAAIDADQARSLLPARYTGFIASGHDRYKVIEDAGQVLGRIPRGV
jgi:phosphonate transport system substrate-binding protein